MNRIRIAFAAALLVAGTAGAADAQAPGAGRRAPRGAEHEKHAQDLNLTEAQKQSIRAIHERYRTQFEAIRESARPDMEAARAARQRGDTAAARAAMTAAKAKLDGAEALRDRQRAEVRALLTAEQQAKFDAQATNRRERMAARDGRDGKRREGGRKARPNHAPRPERRRG